MLRKFIGFHCLENEDIVLSKSNAEIAADSPDLPRTRESEMVIVTEKKTSPTKKLTVLQVAVARKPTPREGEKTVVKNTILAYQECLLSSSDEESERLKKFLREKLDLLSGERLARIVEVDPSNVFERLDKSLVERGNSRIEVVRDDEEMPISDVDRILRSELKEKSNGAANKSQLCDMDANVTDRVLPKSVAFQLSNENCRSSSTGYGLVGVSDAGQSFSGSSQLDGTDYGTSKFESNAWRRVDEPCEARMYGTGAVGCPSFSGTVTQQRVSTGRSKWEPFRKTVSLKTLSNNYIPIGRLLG